jgi:hypothetical protein
MKRLEFRAIAIRFYSHPRGKMGGVFWLVGQSPTNTPQILYLREYAAKICHMQSPLDWDSIFQNGSFVMDNIETCLTLC